MAKDMDGNVDTNEG